MTRKITLSLLLDKDSTGLVRLAKAHREELYVEVGETVEIKKGILFHSAGAKVAEALSEEEKEVARVSPDVMEEGNFKEGDKCVIRKIMLD